MLPFSIGKNGARIYSATDVATALDGVTKLRQDLKYRFFRGQENSNWLPTPSLARVPEASRDEVRERLVRFAGYTREVSRLVGIEYSDDDIWAIGQHYGLPTNFLDLTTDPIVAAMFACPPQTAWQNEKAAIFLYSDEMIRSWQSFTERGREKSLLELITLDVSNLWRLQAQRGLFLFNPYINFCDLFMPDCITFPHPEGGFVQDGYELYPACKSPLEFQLDLFFDLEGKEKSKEDLRKTLPVTLFSPTFSDELFGDATPRLAAAKAHLSGAWLAVEEKLHDDLRNNISGIVDSPLHALPDTYFLPMWKFKHAELRPHESWFSERARAWVKTGIEMFQPRPADSSDRIVIDLNLFTSKLPCGEDTSGKSGITLESRPRDKDIRFLVSYSPIREDPDEEKAYRADLLQRVGTFAEYLWAGLRRTPISTDTITKCLSNFFTGVALQVDSDDKRVFWDECYGERYSKHLKLEYVPLGAHSRIAKILCNDLAPAIRPDFDDVVAVVPTGRAAALPLISVHLQQMIFPQYLFDFHHFSDVFVAYVLPYEATMAALTTQPPNRLAFNPRTIKIFGLS